MSAAAASAQAAVQPTRGATLEVIGLHVRYGAVPALHDINLFVAPGAIVAIVGPNGAGKTTLLSAIMGMVGWASGDVRHDGSTLARRRPDQIARRGIALVPEGRQIFGTLTVDENLRLGMVARRSRANAADDLDMVAELFPVVRESRDRAAGLLSGGQQQQLAIARALVADPDLLLLDEPSLGLSPTMIDTVFDSLDAIRRSGRTIVMVEQRAQRAIAFADRSFVLAGGRIRAALDRSDAGNSELLRRAYFGTDHAATAAVNTGTNAT